MKNRVTQFVATEFRTLKIILMITLISLATSVVIYKALLLLGVEQLAGRRTSGTAFLLSFSFFLFVIQTAFSPVYRVFVKLLVLMHQSRLLFYIAFTLQVATGMWLIIDIFDIGTSQLNLFPVILLFLTSLLLGLVLRVLLSPRTIIRLRDEQQATNFILANYSIAILIILILLYSSFPKMVLLGVVLCGAALGEGIQHLRITSSTKRLLREQTASDLRAYNETAISREPVHFGDIYGGLKRQARKGLVLRPLVKYWFYKIFTNRLRDAKEDTKVRALILYHLQRFESVLKRIRAYEKSLGFSPSETLVSLKALASARLGKLDDAIRILLDRISGSSYEAANIYHLVNLGHLFYQNRELERAMSITNEVLKRQDGKSCPLAFNNQAYFLCEKAFLTSEPNSVEWKHIAREAESLIQKATDLSQDKHLGNMLDTRGMVHLLFDQYNDALACFARAALINQAARFHLGLMLMVGTKQYYRSEYFLRLVVQSKAPANSILESRAQHFLGVINQARKSHSLSNAILIAKHLQPFVTTSNQPSSRKEVRRLILVQRAKECFELDGLAGIAQYIVRVIKEPAYACTATSQIKRGDPS